MRTLVCHVQTQLPRSGVDKESISIHDILTVDTEGCPVGDSGLQPSSETLLHTMLYRSVEAGAVLHTHSLAAAILSKLAGGHDHLVLSGWELLKGLNGVETHETDVVLPIFPNSQSIQSLSASIEPCLKRDKPFYGFLLAGHGISHLPLLDILLKTLLSLSF